MHQKFEYIHKLNSNSKYNQNKGKTLVKMPGVFYRLVGEFLSEKLPMIIFTSRVSFKIALVHQIEYYEQQRQVINFQVKNAQYELMDLQK